MAYPTTNSLGLPLVGPDGTSLGTVTMTVDQYEMSAECSTSPLTVSLPAGTWRTFAWIRCLPAEVAVPATYDSGPLALTTDGSLSVPSLWLRTYLPLETSGEVVFAVAVYQVVDSIPVPYASTWQSQEESSIVIPQAPPARTAGVAWGSACQPVVIAGPAPTYPATGNPANLGGLLRQLASTGATLTRASVQWELLVPSGSQGRPQSFSPAMQSVYDTFFSACSANGLKAIIQLGSTAPAWASRTGAAGAPPRNQTDYTNYVKAVLERWGPDIYSVEGSNEPNGFTPAGPGWAPTGQPTRAFQNLGWKLSDFVTEQQTRYAAARAYSANVLVSTAGIAFGDAAWLAALYSLSGFAGHFDAVSIHPYSLRWDRAGSGTPTGYGLVKGPELAWGDQRGDPFDLLSACAAIYKVMSAHRDGAKSVHVTEFGWSTGRSGTTPGMMSSLDVTEAQQASYLGTALRQLARVPYVSAVNTYDFYDTAGYNAGTWGPEPVDNWSMFGLVDMLGTRQKLAYPVFQETLTAIAGGTG